MARERGAFIALSPPSLPIQACTSVLVRKLLDVADTPACIFDENDRLLGWNNAYVHAFPECLGAIQNGAPYQSVLRWSFGSDGPDEFRLYVDNCISINLSTFRLRSRSAAFQRRDKRWIEAERHLLPDGFVLVLWTDATARIHGLLSSIVPKSAAASDLAFIHISASGDIIAMSPEFHTSFWSGSESEEPPLSLAKITQCVVSDLSFLPIKEVLQDFTANTAASTFLRREEALVVKSNGSRVKITRSINGEGDVVFAWYPESAAVAKGAIVAETSPAFGNALFRKIMEVSGLGVVVHSDGVPLYANTEWAEQRNIPFDLLLKAQDIYVMEPELEKIAEYVSDGSRINHNVTYKRVNSGGDERYLAVTVEEISWGTEDASLLISKDVTDYESQKIKLIENESFLRSLMRIGKIGAYRVNVDEKLRASFSYFGGEAAALYGLDISQIDPEENLTELCFARAHPDDVKKYRQTLDEHVAGQAVTDITVRLKNAQDQYRFVREIEEAIYGLDGQPIAYLGVVMDVSDQIEIAERLKEREALFRSMLDNSVVGISITATSGPMTGKRLYQNAKHMAMLGARTEEEAAAMQPVNSYVLKEDFALAQEIAKTEQGNVSFEAERLRLDGSHWWCLVGVQPIRYDGVTADMAWVMDTTDRKSAEAERDRQHLLLQSIINSVHGAISVTDRTGRYILANATFEELLGVEKEDYLNRTSVEIFPEQIGRHFRELEEEILERGKAIMGIEFSWPTSDAGYWLGHKSPVIDNAGEVQGVVTVAMDVSSLREARAEVKRARAAALIIQSQKMEAIGAFASGIAHDFNNLLGSILGFAELALTVLAQDDKARRYLQEIRSTVVIARSLAQKITAFGRVETKEFVATELNQLLESAGEIARGSLPDNVSLSVKLPIGILWGNANAVEIQQVILNLISNARHAMPDGGHVEISLDSVSFGTDEFCDSGPIAPGLYARIQVADTGQGIPDEIKKKIFDPFFTTKSFGQGTGLGLAIVHRIIVEHAGGILVSTKVGEGSKFSVYIPISAAGTTFAEEAPHVVRKGNGEILLLVDDDERLVESGQEILSLIGYRVFSFVRSEEALQFFSQRPEEFDLVVTDYSMPGIDGIGLVDAIRDLRPSIPILMMSGNSSVIPKESLRRVEPIIVLEKPIAMNEMADGVAAALASGHAGGK